VPGKTLGLTTVESDAVLYGFKAAGAVWFTGLQLQIVEPDTPNASSRNREVLVTSLSWRKGC
jgi:hypothetical protein